MRLALVIAVCGLTVAGCDRYYPVEPDRVPASSYQTHSCEQLTEEAQAMSARLAKATGQDYSGDTIAMAVGRVVFFPILVFDRGRYVDPLELGRLNRQMQAIEQASNQKNCGITFRHVRM
jgi:hypothetical protein